MFFGIITMLILYLILRYILSWITYFNNLDPRLGDSTWRWSYDSVSYTHLRAHETVLDLVCRLLLEKNISHEFKNYEIFKASDTMVDSLTQLIARKRSKNNN